MINVANFLAQNTEHRVQLYLGTTTGPMRESIADEVDIVDLGAPRARSILRPLRAQIRSARPDVLVSALMICDLIALGAKMLGIGATKLVISVQNDPQARASGSVSGLQRRWPTLIRRFYGRADAVAAISTGAAEAVAELLGRPAASVPVIHNPVVAAGFEAKTREEPDHPWFAGDGPPVILSAGRLIRQKDHPTLLRAFAELAGRRDVRLIVIGEGEDRDALERLAAELGIADRVAFPGFVGNPYPWMRRARLFVLSSRWEGFGNVLAEALACGTPAVATDCPSGPAEILGDGAYGRLVEVGDVDSLARAMEEALDEPVDRDRLSARGREFDIERIGPQYQALIEGTAAR